MFFRATKAAVLSAMATLCLFSTQVSAGGWKLLWSDEFDSTALNEGSWTVSQTDNPPNAEQQDYIGGHDQAGAHVFVKNGNLILESTYVGGRVMSGKIQSSGKKTFMYGRMEARMRLPVTQGMWPAFWMLGVGGGWPSCGEIDIMEGKGRLPSWTSGAFHSSQGTPVVSGNYTMPTGNVHDTYHTYAIQWNADSIQWFFENVNFLTLRKSQHAGIPLDKQYYFILNLAVGGNFDGNFNTTTVFPESLIVDYVRAYMWDPNVAARPAPATAAPVPTAVRNTGGGLFVSLPSSQTYYFELVSLDGARVMSAHGTAASFTIETGALPAGAYYAVVHSDLGTMTDRIIVPR